MCVNYGNFSAYFCAMQVLFEAKLNESILSTAMRLLLNLTYIITRRVISSLLPTSDTTSTLPSSSFRSWTVSSHCVCGCTHCIYMRVLDHLLRRRERVRNKISYLIAFSCELGSRNGGVMLPSTLLKTQCNEGE